MDIVIDYSRDNLIDPYAMRILKDRYLMPEEKSPQDAFARAAKAFADDQAHAQRLYGYVSKQWFMFATPVLANGGTSRGLPISCFLSAVGDSLEGIIDHESESSWLAAMGGGLGAGWSFLRTNKTKTSRGGESTGAIPFIAQFDRKVLAYRQAGTRRAAYAAYLSVSHPEIMEFINMRKPTGGAVERKALNIHNAVSVPDSFMEKLFVKDDRWELKDPHTGVVTDIVSARELWSKLLMLRIETGEPYFFFIDNANKALPEEQKRLGLRINTSNLCVAPETKILTKEYGYVPIVGVADTEVHVWNGEEWSLVTPRKTGESKELIRVTFNNGITIDCTSEHKFYVQKNYWQPPVQVAAKDLKPEDKLQKFSLPKEYPDCEHTSAIDWYSQGFYAGDGNEDYNFSWIYAPKAMCIPRLKGKISDDATYNRYRWSYSPPINKFYVPTGFYASVIMEWLSGLFDADGCVIQSTNGVNIQLASVNYSFLKEIHLLMQELGVYTSLSHRREAGVFELPKNDGSGENGEYNCSEVWLLNFNGPAVVRLLELGLNCSRLILDKNRMPNRDACRFIKVQSVERTGRISDTYCATEPKRGRLMFNGVLTGNCNEIYLPTDEQRTAVCCLSSVNLAKFDEWRNTSMVYDLIKMLDNVIDAFIQAPHLKPSARHAIRKALYSASRERSLGLGAMGFHSYLQNKLIPFESEEASRINVEMFSYIREQAEDATYDIAVSKGSCPDYIEGKGMQWRRNMHLIAVAPNASSSILCGNVSPSIEPFSAVSFSQKTENGTHIFKNPRFLQLLQEKGLSDDDIKTVWRSVGAKKGSVQHLDILTDEEKSVFKTAFELDQMWVIRHAADRQKYIDQGQSVNLFFINPVDVSYLHNTHYEAWKRGLKGLYYCRNKIESSIEDIGQKIERQHLLTEDKTSATNEVKQTKFKTTTPTGFEIECVGCEA
jgi:ribonucleotide reductase alpha subunit